MGVSACGAFDLFSRSIIVFFFLTILQSFGRSLVIYGDNVIFSMAW